MAARRRHQDRRTALDRRRLDRRADHRGRYWRPAPWPIICATSARSWEGELRLTAKTNDVGRSSRSSSTNSARSTTRTEESRRRRRAAGARGFDGGDRIYVLAGIAAHDGQIVCSMIRQNELLVVDVAKKEIIQHIALGQSARPGLRLAGPAAGSERSKAGPLRQACRPSRETIISAGLEDPRHVAFDRDGNLFITDRGKLASGEKVLGRLANR